MNKMFEEMRNASRIIICGIMPLTEAEAWKKFREVLGVLPTKGLDFSLHVIVESENQLFQHSLRSDTTYSDYGFDDAHSRLTFKNMQMRCELVKNEMRRIQNDLIEKHCKSIDGQPKENDPLARKIKENITFRVSHLWLPVNVVALDGRYLMLPSGLIKERDDFYLRVDSGELSIWQDRIATYVERLCNSQKDGRYLSRPGDELLEMFDQEHTPRGIFPRSCFYDTDYYQYVVWCFIFSRDGKLLIHKRDSNAKDNRDMWDKSVGGHIDFSRERSSADAAIRELIEELYTDEAISNKKYALLSEDISGVFFLGDWRPESIGPDYLKTVEILERDAKLGEEPWVMYKIPDTIELNSPREIPETKDKKAQTLRLRVLVDAFIVIANTSLNSGSLDTLKNSAYRLRTPSQIKSDNEDKSIDFKATPDLEYILTGRLREILDEVSMLLEYSSVRK